MARKRVGIEGGRNAHGEGERKRKSESHRVGWVGGTVGTMLRYVYP